MAKWGNDMQPKDEQLRMWLYFEALDPRWCEEVDYKLRRNIGHPGRSGST